MAYKKHLESDENLVIFTSSSYKANKLYSSLTNFINEKDIILFLENEMIRVEYISSSKDILSNRIYALNEMINAKHKIFILTPSSLCRFYPTKEEFVSSILKLKVGNKLDIKDIIFQLTKFGYTRTIKIDQSLQFATRGDIVDIFSINYDNPIRIEFFDDEIESIRFFDIATQRSLESINEISVLPGTTLLFNEGEYDEIEDKILNRLKADKANLRDDLQELLEAQIDEDIQDLKQNNFSARLYKYYGFLKQNKVNVLSYISSFNEIILEKEEFLLAKKNLIEESHYFLLDLYESGRSITHLELFNDVSFIDKAKQINYVSSTYEMNESKLIPISNPFLTTKNGMEYQKIIDLYLKEFNQLVIVVKDNNQLKETEAYLSFLKQEFKVIQTIDDEFDKKISILLGDFNISFEIRDEGFALIDSALLFNQKRKELPYSGKFKQGTILERFEDLQKGDYIVHEKYGIGKFIGVEQVTFGNKTEDYLRILYKNDDKLMVPLNNFTLIRKYSGKDGKAPQLSALNSDKWQKTKKRIKERVNLLADKLLALYREKVNTKGFAFPKDDEIQALFENKFKHELTKDQEKSLEEIKEDMEKDIPMDRLLCGDVGFGKTEVAFRAAFKAILGGKQVAFLAPTTLLAKQHYELALRRFAGFDVDIKLLTRFQTPSEVKNIMENLSRGKINMVIGTHKLLGKDIVFKDLGLLIIDEEQRFGVEQKEKIHMKKQNIDILTLSATPIPRTLQSSLIGLKSVSTIQTPPKERIPIQTYIIDRDFKVIKEIIEKELGRNGQIYFVHNDIFTIYDLADKLLEMIPTLKIGIIHAKMNKSDIDEVMMSFYSGEIDLLLATTIIENGIDVRNANLILVDNANTFGLAQLYQIKGRVGRGDRMAFCYLLVSRGKKLNDESRKRLKAIQDFTELGSGYKIAQRDLLIRGAGDILGPEQAGFIEDVGIDMYLKLVNEVVTEKQTGVKIEKGEEKNVASLFDNAYIPEDFAGQSEKMELYQKINDVNSIEKLSTITKYIEDLYGNVPENIQNLLTQRKLEIFMEYPEFEELKEFDKRLDLILSKQFTQIEGIGTTLFQELVNYLSVIKLSYINQKIVISITKVINERRNYRDILFKILDIIHKEAVENEIRQIS